jgi:hypothetical protein
LARRALILSGLATLALAAGAAPPADALHVQWRWVDAQQPPSIAGAAADGSRVTSTAGSFDARPGLTQRSAPVDEAPVQRLRVMNGERASLRLAEHEALPQLTLWRGAKGDHGAVSFVDAVRVQSFSVRPRWPGGRAPVTLEIEAASGDAAAPLRWTTTLAVPLGLWATVASVGDTASAVPQAGVLSTRDVTPAHARELQVRVTR